MKIFLKVRIITFISTCIITYFFTGSLFFASALSLTLIGVNTILMYLLLKNNGTNYL